MMVVTHEMGFARKVADASFSWTRGAIVETGTAEDFFSRPATERGTRLPVPHPVPLMDFRAMIEMQDLPVAGDVLDAAGRLSTAAVVTTLLNSPDLDARLGGRVLIKAENLQRTGAFKFRGAFNCLSRLDPRRFPGGVVAYSTGNHGQAIATVARMLGLQATIVMPTDAPTVKVAKARQQGRQSGTLRPPNSEREEIATAIAGQSAAAIIPPGDNRYVVAGQGTAALEALRQAGGSVDTILVPCGGGGLTCGHLPRR